MDAYEVTPESPGQILPGAEFSDAWEIDGISASDDARTISARIFRNGPGWVTTLLRLRNLLVKPFRLITDPTGSKNFEFPVISSNRHRVVLGFDDRHLDFRVVVDLHEPDEGNRSVSATTHVRTRNSGGKLYLSLVRPFHRKIVPTLLERSIATH